MTNFIRAIVFGLVSWAVPFAVSYGLIDQNGQFVAGVGLFKSVMFVSAAAVTAVLLVLYFRHVHSRYLRESVLLSILWLEINLMLDLLVLVPLTHMNLYNYVFQVGFGYLFIPVMCVMAGLLLSGRSTASPARIEIIADPDSVIPRRRVRRRRFLARYSTLP